LLAWLRVKCESVHLATVLVMCVIVRGAGVSETKRNVVWRAR